MHNQVIMGLNLSVLFAFSILMIALIGIIIIRYTKTKSLKIKKLERDFIFLFILLEVGFISGFLVYQKVNYFRIINLATALITFILYIIIFFSFWKFLEKKLVFINLFFGATAIAGIIYKLFVENIFGHILHLIGIIGLTIFSPLLVIKLLIDNQEKRK